MDNDNVTKNVSDVLSQCMNINNAYKIKHEELKEVYKAYKILHEKNRTFNRKCKKCERCDEHNRPPQKCKDHEITIEDCKKCVKFDRFVKDCDECEDCKKCKECKEKECDSSDIEVQLKQISENMEEKIISKTTFKQMLDEQALIMKEFNQINEQISILYPNF